jgi:methanogenic corrinoid protein MtbC1
MVNISRTVGAMREAALRHESLPSVGDAPITQGDAEKWGIEICPAVADVAMG